MPERRSSPERPPQRARLADLLTPQMATTLGANFRPIRKRSAYVFLGLPLYDIALGPDPAASEWRGHARGVLAIGDIATGVIAIGGWARGLIAAGGLATGVIALGGLAIGLGAALGGAALSAGLAAGGGAAGQVAVGGAAAGIYAAGGAAVGQHVLSPLRRDPEAVAFFARFAFNPPREVRGR